MKNLQTFIFINFYLKIVPLYLIFRHLAEQSAII